MGGTSAGRIVTLGQSIYYLPFLSVLRQKRRKVVLEERT